MNRRFFLWGAFAALTAPKLPTATLVSYSNLEVPVIPAVVDKAVKAFDWKTYSVSIVFDPRCPPDFIYIMNSKLVAERQLMVQYLHKQLHG